MAQIQPPRTVGGPASLNALRSSADISKPASPQHSWQVVRARPESRSGTLRHRAGSSSPFKVLTGGSSAAVEHVHPVHERRTTKKRRLLVVHRWPTTAPATGSSRSTPSDRVSRSAGAGGPLRSAANLGRVVSRRELSRQAGLADLSERRCDSILVGLRRRLGSDAIRTVRSRGWMLEDMRRHARQLLGVPSGT